MKILERIFGTGKDDDRSLNQLIFDLAEHHRQSDRQELYRRLKGIEIFANIATANFPLPPYGTQHKIDEGQILGVPSVKLPGGQFMVQFFIDRSDPRLRAECIGMATKDAFVMAMKGPSVEGLVLCNLTNSWVAFLKPEIERLLKGDFA
jgi:hypothetical protein